MYCFLLKRRPHSYGGWSQRKLKGYRIEFENSLRAYCPEYREYDSSELYGLIYYFHRRPTDQDADNLSKPVWDTLKDVLYRDDSSVKFRIAGVFNTSQNDFQTLDVTGLPTDLINDLTTAIEAEDHVVYIECGRLRNELFRFNIE